VNIGVNGFAGVGKTQGSIVSKLTIVMLVAALLSSCTSPCSDEIRTESTSPDHEQIATWFVRDCGATTDFSTIVSRRGKDEQFEGGEHSVFVVKGRPSLRLAWENSERLTIECAGCEQKNIFRESNTLGNLQITYRID
jgi:hypothetical protein